MLTLTFLNTSSNTSVLQEAASMDPVTVAKIVQLAMKQLETEEKRHRMLMIMLSVVFLILFMFSVAIYVVTNPIDALFGDNSNATESSVVIKNYTDIEDTVWCYLKDIGFNDYGAAAVMGNIRIESSFDTAANHNNHYFGLCQWGGNRWDGNPVCLSNFAILKGTSWTDLQTQLSFFEMECRMLYSNVYDQMQNAIDVKYACDYFCTYYEGCVGELGNWAYSMVNGKAYQCLEDRRQYAQFYYNHYA